MSRAPDARLVFDATGTLIEATASVGEVYHRVAREFGVDLPAWRLDDAFRRIMKHAPPRGTEGDSREARCTAEFGWWSEIIRQTFQATDSTARFADFPAFAKALFETYRSGDAWRLRPGMLSLLEVLERENRRLAIASNFDHRLPDVLEALKLKHFFEVIALPCDAGATKPDRALFEHVARALESEIEGLVYIGDDAPDRLAQIAGYGIDVIDIRVLENPEQLADQLLTAAANNA